MRMKDRIIALFYRLVCILKSVCSRNKGQTSIQPQEENTKLRREMRRKLRAQRNRIDREEQLLSNEKSHFLTRLTSGLEYYQSLVKASIKKYT